MLMLLSDVSGVLGLLIGASVITIVETVYAVPVVFILCCTAAKRVGAANRVNPIE
jgi:Amiloride-sensitive sodium channel